MSRYELLIMVHISGALMVFYGLGAVFVRGVQDREAERRKAYRVASAVTYGLGLAALLVAGAMLASELNAGFAGWMAAKLGIWVALGAALPIALRAPSLSRFVWWAVVMLGCAAVYLVIMKPF